MKSVKVVAIGEALIDRLVPPGGDPSVDLPVDDCFGGAPANVACALSRLGVNVAFIGSLGKDVFGRNFKHLLILLWPQQRPKIQLQRVKITDKKANKTKAFYP